MQISSCNANVVQVTQVKNSGHISDDLSTQNQVIFMWTFTTVALVILNVTHSCIYFPSVQVSLRTSRTEIVEFSGNPNSEFTDARSIILQLIYYICCSH